LPKCTNIASLPIVESRAMTYLAKKAAAFGIIILGGIIMLHGIYNAQTWETFAGAALLAVGVLLLVLKIVRRNEPTQRI
jgi:hypothetical protein